MEIIRPSVAALRTTSIWPPGCRFNVECLDPRYHSPAIAMPGPAEMGRRLDASHGVDDDGLKPTR
jgi:hypothetical protein